MLLTCKSLHFEIANSNSQCLFVFEVTQPSSRCPFFQKNCRLVCSWDCGFELHGVSAFATLSVFGVLSVTLGKEVNVHSERLGSYLRSRVSS